MPSEWRYRGRVVTADEVASIRQLIAENPSASRRRLSKKLCEVWQWKQANGALRDMVCRGLLLMLHRAGEIELPPTAMLQLHSPNEIREPLGPAARLFSASLEAYNLSLPCVRYYSPAC